jgi:hypothetical protein
VNDPTSHPADKALNDQFNMAHDLLEQIAEVRPPQVKLIRMNVEAYARAIDADHHDWMERKLRGR